MSVLPEMMLRAPAAVPPIGCRWIAGGIGGVVDVDPCLFDRRRGETALPFPMPAIGLPFESKLTPIRLPSMGLSEEPRSA